MARNKNRKRDTRYAKSKAVKESARKAAQASASKRRKLKEEREAGNQEPVVELDTRPEAQENEQSEDGVERMDAAEKMDAVQEPGQEPVAFGRPELDQVPK
jgi:hypothetical protein